jgi:hypothetical protein|tara:strand:- start:80 stop:379 length:300 start_codon:yes stop_codon:yes gene_type:complete
LDLLKKLVSIGSFYIFVVTINDTIMKDFFEGIEDLFELLLAPLDELRALELDSWFLANGLNWIFMAIGFLAFLYWMKQLKTFNDNNEENRESTSHSFLG